MIFIGNYQFVFSRYEEKYLLNSYQHEQLVKLLEQHMYIGKYGRSQILNLYYDTPDFLLIRRSVAGGTAYKEKLRMRCYCVPDDKSKAFIELKKKYNGIVYKRRMDTTYRQASCYLNDAGIIFSNSQIARELNYFLEFYGNIAPMMFISYDRIAYTGNDDENFRITFDKNITWRTDDLDLRLGVYGSKLLQPEQYLMEMKISDSVPMYLSQELSRLGIFPISYSKYGNAYKKYIEEGTDSYHEFQRFKSIV